MSSITFQDTVTHVPAAWANDVDALVYDIFNAAQTLEDVRTRLGIKAMAYQLDTQVSIKGGSIDGVAAGVTVPLSQVIAEKAQVLDAPVSGTDVVNLDAMAAFVVQKITDAASSFTGGLGSMALQNKNNVSITGGLLDSVDIGTQSRGSGRFTALKASNPPTDGDDVVTLGWLTQNYDVRLNAVRSMAFQDKESVSILGGDIDGVRIGMTTPVQARLLRGTIISAPLNNEDIANKRYVDSSISAFASTLGSMAFQNNYQVNITGGSIDGTSIGAASPNTGRFTALQVINNQALLRLRTTSNAVENQSGVLWEDNGTVASFLYKGSQSSTNPNTLELSASIPINVHTAGAALQLSNVNATITGAQITLGAPTQNQVVIGSGSAVTGMKLSMHDNAHFDKFQVKRSLLLEGATKSINNTYVGAATGVCPLDVNSNPFFDISVTGDVAFTLLSQDNNWPTGFREITLLLKFPNAGKNVVFPSGVVWGNGVGPNYTYAKAGGFDIVRLITRDGVTWYGESAYAANVKFARPPFVTFSASTAGSASYLYWTVHNAVTVELVGSGVVAPTSSVQVPTPSAPTTYTLIATGADGTQVSAQVTVNPAP